MSLIRANSFRMRSARAAIVALAALILAAAAPQLYAQEKIAVRAAVDKQELQVGEPFILQIQVQGSDQVEKPDTAAITDFRVAFEGGNATNRSFTNMVNGRVTHQEFRGYLMNFRLTPLRTGSFTIPALTVTVGGVPYHTRPVGIVVTAAQESADFKVTQTVARTTVYAGETIPLKMIWYFRKDAGDVKEANLSLPALQMPGLTATAPPVPANVPDRGYAQVPLNGEVTVAKFAPDTLDGSPCNSIIITRYLTPQKSGTLTLPPATASCGAVVGYQKGRTNSPFGGMFDDDPFFGNRQAVVKRFYCESQPLTLTVKDLPTAGRPADFSGMIGRFTIAARVEPEAAAVGEPLTLTIMISGADCPENVTLPDLSAQPDLARDFRLPAERAEGKLHGEVMVFTRILRAKSEKVTQVPPLRLSYFDPVSEQYQTALSRPLPLRIEAAKAVTVADVEGGAPLAAASATPLESRAGDIRHNYIDPGCLAPGCADLAGWLADPAWLALLTLPPFLAGLLALVLRLLQKRDGDSARRCAAGALRALRKRIGSDGLNTTELLQALQTYFADRLMLPQAGLTGAEILAQLAGRGASAEARGNVEKIIAHCEAARYGGAAEQTVSPKFAAGILATLEQLEKELR